MELGVHGRRNVALRQKGGLLQKSGGKTEVVLGEVEV